MLDFESLMSLFNFCTELVTLATLASYFQQISFTFNGLGNGGGDSEAESPTEGLALLTGFASLVSLLFSSSAVRIVCFGAILESFRRIALFLQQKIISAFWITAYFTEDDDSYGANLNLLLFIPLTHSPIDWMMVWLAKQAAWCECVFLCLRR
jgi:hypothetical protein